MIPEPAPQNPPVPGSLRQQFASPSGVSGHIANAPPPLPLPHIYQAAARLPNPTGFPGLNPIDPAAAEYPIPHSRNALNFENVPRPASALEPQPSSVRQHFDAPAVAGQNANAPLPRIYQAATHLPNPNGFPGFNPIDPAAADYPLLHSRSAKNFDNTPHPAVTPIRANALDPAPKPAPPRVPAPAPAMFGVRLYPPSSSTSSHSSSHSQSSRSSSENSGGSQGADSQASVSTDSTQVFNVITCLPHPRERVACEKHCECDRHMSVHCSRYMRRCPRLCHCVHREGE